METYPKKLISLIILYATVITTVNAGGNDNPLLTMAKLDQFEVRDTDGSDPLVMDGQLWAGYDLKKLWLKAELENVANNTEKLELQALYSQAVSAFWDIQLGARKDINPTPNREWGVIALQGLAPYNFEIETSLFFGSSGRSAVRLEAEYEFLFTQRLILTPEIEANVFGHNDQATGVGSGLGDIELGLRLRYEIRREFAPYIGLNWQKKYGATAAFAKSNNEDTEDAQIVVGVRAWY
jgi:copper resistance protein B